MQPIQPAGAGIVRRRELILPVAGECVNRPAVQEHFLFVVAVFTQHALCNCQLQAQEKAIKSFFSLLLIELCKKEEGAGVGKVV